MLWSVCSPQQDDVQSATFSQIHQAKPKLWPFWYIYSSIGVGSGATFMSALYLCQKWLNLKMLWSICSALQEDVQSATSSQIPQVKPKLWPFWYICSFCSCLFHIGYYSQYIFLCPLYNSPKKDWISKCFGQFVSVKQEDVQSPKVCQIPQAKPKLWPFWYI